MDHGHQVVGVHLVTDLHANGVADATHELHMGSIELPCALATPQEVACKAGSCFAPTVQQISAPLVQLSCEVPCVQQTASRDVTQRACVRYMQWFLLVVKSMLSILVSIEPAALRN